MNDAKIHAAKLANEAAPGASENVKAREAAIVEAELDRRAVPAEQSPLAGLAPEQVVRVVIGRALAVLAEERVPDALVAAELIRVALAAMAVRLGDCALLPTWLEALAAEMRSDSPPNFSTRPTVN